MYGLVITDNYITEFCSLEEAMKGRSSRGIIYDPNGASTFRASLILLSELLAQQIKPTITNLRFTIRSALCMTTTG